MKTFILFIFLIVSFCAWAQQNNSLTVVYNNVPSENHLKTDWGYAAWLEVGDNVILFDAGTKGGLLHENFEKLNLDPSKISAIAISHEHYDHAGGLESVLNEVEKGVKVYLPNDFDSGLKKKYPKLRFVVNNKFREIADDVWLTDIFIDNSRGIKEQALVVINDKSLIVITGCAHPGIAKMCEAITKQFPNKKYELVTGGFHLMRTSESEVNEISAKIKKLGFEQVAPSHCTGDQSIKIFEQAWGDQFISLNLGDSYRF